VTVARIHVLYLTVQRVHILYLAVVRVHVLHCDSGTCMCSVL
jgi:hypothetical protein